MCDRCEQKGLLAGLLTKAGVIASPDPLPTPLLISEPASPPTPAESRSASRRGKLWDLEERLHCPVIGTCLTLDELKKIARKDGFAGQDFEPYRLHVEAVSASCSRNSAAEAMHKALERKHALAVRRFQAATTEDEVLALWREYLERGEVAGAMWAALTHKAAGRQTRNQVYGDVHMLSHQVGAGQAADLRRLEWLEGEQAQSRAENSRLRDELRRQAEQAEATRRDLAQAREQAAQVGSLEQRLRELQSGQAMVALGRQLMLAQSQVGQLREAQARIRELEDRAGVLRGDKARLSRQLAEATAERDALERLWLDEPGPGENTCDGDCGACEHRLRGRCVLCVGGRAPLLPQYRQLAERLGVRLIHHDGGREEALARLPELLHASDAVICPTDCVSHLAYYQVKKHCKQLDKPCVLTRNSGVAGFAAALNRLAEGRADIRSQT
jgi:hypothetical protein